MTEQVDRPTLLHIELDKSSVDPYARILSPSSPSCHDDVGLLALRDADDNTTKCFGGDFDGLPGVQADGVVSAISAPVED